jgi:hypothetical protein
MITLLYECTVYSVPVRNREFRELFNTYVRTVESMTMESIDVETSEITIVPIGIDVSCEHVGKSRDKKYKVTGTPSRIDFKDKIIWGRPSIESMDTELVRSMNPSTTSIAEIRIAYLVHRLAQDDCSTRDIVEANFVIETLGYYGWAIGVTTNFLYDGDVLVCNESGRIVQIPDLHNADTLYHAITSKTIRIQDLAQQMTDGIIVLDGHVDGIDHINLRPYDHQDAMISDMTASFIMARTGDDIMKILENRSPVGSGKTFALVIALYLVKLGSDPRFKDIVKIPALSRIGYVSPQRLLLAQAACIAAKVGIPFAMVRYGVTSLDWDTCKVFDAAISSNKTNNGNVRGLGAGFVENLSTGDIRQRGQGVNRGQGVSKSTEPKFFICDPNSVPVVVSQYPMYWFYDEPAADASTLRRCIKSLSDITDEAELETFCSRTMELFESPRLDVMDARTEHRLALRSSLQDVQQLHTLCSTVKAIRAICTGGLGASFLCATMPPQVAQLCELFGAVVDSTAATTTDFPAPLGLFSKNAGSRTSVQASEMFSPEELEELLRDPRFCATFGRTIDVATLQTIMARIDSGEFSANTTLTKFIFHKFLNRIPVEQFGDVGTFTSTEEIDVDDLIEFLLDMTTRFGDQGQVLGCVSPRQRGEFIENILTHHLDTFYSRSLPDDCTSSLFVDSITIVVDGKKQVVKLDHQPVGRIVDGCTHGFHAIQQDLVRGENIYRWILERIPGLPVVAGEADIDAELLATRLANFYSSITRIMQRNTRKKDRRLAAQMKHYESACKARTPFQIKAELREQIQRTHSQDIFTADFRELTLRLGRCVPCIDYKSDLNTILENCDGISIENMVCLIFGLVDSSIIPGTIQKTLIDSGICKILLPSLDIIFGVDQAFTGIGCTTEFSVKLGGELTEQLFGRVSRGNTRCNGSIYASRSAIRRMMTKGSSINGSILFECREGGMFQPLFDLETRISSVVQHIKSSGYQRRLTERNERRENQRLRELEVLARTTYNRAVIRRVVPHVGPFLDGTRRRWSYFKELLEKVIENRIKHSTKLRGDPKPEPEGGFTGARGYVERSCRNVTYVIRAIGDPRRGIDSKRCSRVLDSLKNFERGCRPPSLTEVLIADWEHHNPGSRVRVDFSARGQLDSRIVLYTRIPSCVIYTLTGASNITVSTKDARGNDSDVRGITNKSIWGIDYKQTIHHRLCLVRQKMLLDRGHVKPPQRQGGNRRGGGRRRGGGGRHRGGGGNRRGGRS